MSDEARNKSLATEYLGAFKTWDPNKYLKYVAEDASFRVGHDTWPGHEGFRRATEIAVPMYPEGVQTSEPTVVAEGNEVVIRHVTRAENYYGGGEVYENYYAIVFQFSPEGLITLQHEYLDTAYAARLGARAGREWHL